LARLAVELGSTQGWYRSVGDAGDMLDVGFGASAPTDVLLNKYGFTIDNVVLRAQRLLAVTCWRLGANRDLNLPLLVPFQKLCVDGHEHRAD